MSWGNLDLKQKIITHKEILIYALLGVVTFVLSTNFSKDWYYYQYFYEKKTESIDWYVYLKDLSILKEPLYLLLSKFFGSVIGYSTFILLTTVTLLTLKLNCLKKVTGSVYVGTFFYICFYLFLFEGTALRTGYATAFIVAALYYLMEQKTLPAVLLVLLASQVHFTAVAFLIVFPLYFFNSINSFVRVAFLFSPLFIMLDISALGLMKELAILINPKYIFYFSKKVLTTQNSTGLYVYFTAFFAILLSVIFYYLKDSIISNRFKQTIFSTMLVGVIVMCVFNDFVALGARLGELLLLPIVIFLSYLYMHFNLNKMYIHKVALITLSLMFLSARVMYLYPTMLNG